MVNTKLNKWWAGSISGHACFGDTTCVSDMRQLGESLSYDSDAENFQVGTYQRELSHANDQYKNHRTSELRTMIESNGNMESFDTSYSKENMTKIIRLDIPEAKVVSAPKRVPEPEVLSESKRAPKHEEECKNESPSSEFGSQPESESEKLQNLDAELAEKLRMIEKALEDVAKVRVLYDQKCAEALEKKQSISSNGSPSPSMISTAPPSPRSPAPASSASSASSHRSPPPPPNLANESTGDRLHRKATERQARMKYKIDKMKKCTLPTPHSEKAGNRLHQQAVERQNRLKKIALAEEFLCPNSARFRLDRSIPAKVAKLVKKKTKTAYRL